MKAAALLIIALAVSAFASAAEWSGAGQGTSAPRAGTDVKLFSYWNDAASAGFESAVLSTNESGSWENYSGNYGSPLLLRVFEWPVTIDHAAPGPNYAVRVALNEANFNYSRCSADGGDVRFYSAPAPPAADPASQLVYWKFDNNSAYGENGTRAYDYSGSGHNGTIDNSGLVTSVGYANGVSNEALTFVAVATPSASPSPSDGSFVSADLNAPALGNSYTLEAWINMTLCAAYYETIITFGTNDDLWLGVYNRALQYWYQNAVRAINAPGAISCNKWFHVAYTWDGATNDNRLYVGGELVAAATPSVPIGGAGLMVGSSPNGEYFIGSIDSVIVSNRTLSGDEVRDHATLVPTDAELPYWREYWRVNASAGGQPPAANGSEQVLYLKFDNNPAFGENATLAYDYSGNGNNGTINGATYVDGKLSKALSFGGTAYVTAPNIDLTDRNYSVEWWVKRGASQPTGYGAMLNKGYTSNQKVYYLVTDAGTLYRWDGFNSGITLDADTWYHVAYTFNGTSDTYGTERFVVNGGQHTATRTGAIPAWDTTNSLFIGSAGPGGSPFNGAIDNVIFYNRTLSDTEILEHYNAAAEGNDSSFVVSLPDAGTSGFVMRCGNSSLTYAGTGPLTPSANATVWPERALSLFRWNNASVPGGTRVAWQIWANDSSGNWNATPIRSFLLGLLPTARVELPSYSSCGSIHYRVSPKDETGNPVDADLTISALDPSGTTRYSASASTIAGVLQSSFALPPLPPGGGLWTLRASACGVLGQKKFYSGEGDGNVLSVTASGDKIRYAQGDAATFDVKVTDQHGIGVAGLRPGNLTAIIDSSTPADSVSDGGAGSYTITHDTSALSTGAAHQLTVRAWSGALNASASVGFYVVP